MSERRHAVTADVRSAAGGALLCSVDVRSRGAPRMLDRVPAALDRGPAVVRGAQPAVRTGAGFAPLPTGAACALSFAVQDGLDFRPFQRLAWTGGDPLGATWSGLDRDGRAVADPDAIAAEYADVAAAARAAGPRRVALALRFECAVAGATLAPGELAWTATGGRTVLVHLPRLDAGVPFTAPEPSALRYASEPVRVAEDGSTWASEAPVLRRRAAQAMAGSVRVTGRA